MLHNIRVDQIAERGQVMADAISSCVHCGFCLSACPTYAELGDEAESPRGRILLMKAVLEQDLPADQVSPHLDQCLGCLSCEPACPSGVQYGHLLTSFRAWHETIRARSASSRLARWIMLHSLPFPARGRLAFLLGRLARPMRGILPQSLSAPLELLPRRVPARLRLPILIRAKGEKRARVALLAGCVQQVLAPEINLATARVLANNGIEVVVPKGQGCCGALAAHAGAMRLAKASARRNLDCFPSDVDAIVINAAGCGSGVREYPIWFEGDDHLAAARQLADKSVDVSAFLCEIGLRTPRGFAQTRKVAYHDACHLASAQGVVAQPRHLLAQIPNLELLEIRGGPSCCGSAGTYNLEQPDLARKFGEAKARAVMETGAEAVCSGNLGCIVQLRTHLSALESTIQVRHTMQILDEAYA